MQGTWVPVASQPNGRQTACAAPHQSHACAQNREAGTACYGAVAGRWAPATESAGAALGQSRPWHNTGADHGRMQVLSAIADTAAAHCTPQHVTGPVCRPSSLAGMQYAQPHHRHSRLCASAKGPQTPDTARAEAGPAPRTLALRAAACHGPCLPPFFPR